VVDSSWPVHDARRRRAARRPATGRVDTRRRFRRGARRLLLPAAHVTVLTTFAFAQPLFDLLGRNAEFFTVRGSTRSDVVAFTVAAVLIPPALLLAVEALAMAVGVLVWLAVHLAIVAGLTGLVVLGALHAQLGGGAAVIVLAVLLGLGASAAYLVVPAVRSFVTVLAPAPLIVAVLFLFNSPVSKLLTPEDTLAAPAAAVTSRAPVVLLVLDEFSTIALLDGQGKIDAKRYPNFARLAGTSTFYRDATTVHSFTQDAVPSILTGRLPDEDALAIYVDHPENIFTLLRDDYRLRAREWLTRLCPHQLCPRGAKEAVAPGAQPAIGGSFASDVTTLYLHTVVPSSFADRLPPVEGTWGNFGARGAASVAAAAAATDSGGANRSCAPVCRYVDALASVSPETLYVLHLPLPHAPWVHLPSGRSTVGDMRRFPESLDSSWGESETLTEQAYARYLLQVGATDRALGLLFEQLDARRLFEDALIVVVADHGLSFELGEVRREATTENIEEVAFVPLFVKLPHQRRGAEQAGLARTIDVVPTIADALGVEIPWPVDGESLIGRRLPRDGMVVIGGNDGRSASAELSDLIARRDEELAEQVERFGTGTWERMYASGPLARYVGRSLAELGPGTASDLRAELDSEAFLRTVDLASGLVPAYITGRVVDGAAGWDVAVALNGRVVAATRTYDASDGVRFAAVVPDDALHDGSNQLHVLVSRGGALERVPTTGASMTLSDEGIRLPDGTLVPFSDALRGTVSARFTGARVTFNGWAADLETRVPRDELAIFVDGVHIHTASGAPIGRGRPPHYDGIPGVSFDFVLPTALLPKPGGEGRVQVFALAGGRAGELEYAPGYPWRHKPE
jgi:sulfatase-like protein